MILIRVRFGLALLKWNWLNETTTSLGMGEPLILFPFLTVLRSNMWWVLMSTAARERCTLYPTILSKLKSGRCDIEWLGRFWPRVTSKHDEHIGQFRSGRQCYGYVKMRCVWFRLIGKKHTTWHLSHIKCKSNTVCIFDDHDLWHSNVYPLYNHTTSIHF